MSVLPSTPIPAGWYPDPAGSFQQRWWNGSEWTNDFAQYRPTLIHSAPLVEALQAQSNVQASSATYTAQQAAATVHNGKVQLNPAPTQTLVREAASTQAEPATHLSHLPAQDRAPHTTTAQPNARTAMLVPVNPLATNFGAGPTIGAESVVSGVSREYQPFVVVAEPEHNNRNDRFVPAQRYTTSVWVLAVLPAALVAVAYAFAVLLPAQYTTLLVAILGAAYALASFGLSARDHTTLSRAGHSKAVSSGWVLLTPLAYLSLRALAVSRETGRTAIAPLLVFLVVVAAIVVAVLLIPTLGSLLFTATALY